MRLFLSSVLLVSLALAGCSGGGGDSTDVARPTITGISPTQLNPGTENIEGRIYGTNLNGVTGVQIGQGVVVRQFSTITATELYIYFSVLRDATPGARTVNVVTMAGVAQSSSGMFTVGDNRIPEARFTVTPPTGYKATVFKFDGSGSNDDGSIVNYQWKFGDGGAKNGKVVNYQFERAGTFPVRLTVTDNRGATHVAERVMDIDPSKPPVAQFSVSPSSGNVNTTFRFDASSSRDPDGKISGYAWNFGDGRSARGMVVEHKYTSESNYPASLSVSDNTGQSSHATKYIRVEKGPEPPPPPPGDDDDDDDGGGNGGSCDAGNFFTNYFTVVNYSGNTITADQSFRECPGLCGEVRRPGGVGVREFVGDILGISGTQIRINTGTLPASTRPEPGERLNILWKGCGS